jgi:pimeloyl-ACP methyl ester carboxylesterase
MGSFVSPEVGRFDPDHVIGVHVTQFYSFPSGDPAEFAALSPEEERELALLRWFRENKMAYNNLQSTQPQTLAYALLDSPVGLLAWNGQLFGNDVDRDFALTNVTLYWLTGTAGSSARMYYENMHAERPTEPTTTPTGLAAFANDFSGIRRFAERDHTNIVHWSVFDRGGHYAAHQEPDLFVGDVREFFGRFR